MTAPIIFKYDEYDDNGKLIGGRQLNFVLGILGNFSGKQEEVVECVEVSQKNFNVFVKEHLPTIRMQVPNILFGEKDEEILLEIKIQDIRFDFKPENFCKQVPFFKEYVDFLKKLEANLKNTSVVIVDTFDMNEMKFLKSYIEASKLELTPIDMVHLIASGYELLNRQINHILYHPTFEEIEVNWLSLINLLIHTREMPNVKIKVFDMLKSALEHDLISGAQELSESEIFYHLYVKELDQYGGEPVNLLLNSFGFDKDDVKLANSLGELGKICSCPILSSIDEGIFELPDISYLMNTTNFTDFRKVPSFEGWAELAKGANARFLGLFVPSIKIRDPYKENSNFIGGVPFVDINPDTRGMHGLYGTGIYAAVIPFLRSYQKYWTCFGAEDEDCAIIDTKDLPKRGEILECAFTERVKKSLGDFGVMSFTYADSRRSIKLGDLNMFSISAIFDRADLTIEQRMNVRLPQLLFISQITHYMRMIKRNSIANKSMVDLKNEILSWLSKFISDTGVDSVEIQMTKPLKSASIDLVEVKTKKGSYLDFRLSIVPHSRYKGLQYGLNL